MPSACADLTESNFYKPETLITDAANLTLSDRIQPDWRRGEEVIPLEHPLAAPGVPTELTLR